MTQETQTMASWTAAMRLYHAATATPALVDVPPLNVLAVDGSGAPEGEEFQAGIGALYSLAYTTKFGRKKAGMDGAYKILPLEGLWWTEGDGSNWLDAARTSWRWRIFIVQPEFITSDDITRSFTELEVKGKLTPATPRARLETFDEGRAAQILHLGPYSAEAPTIARLHQFIEEQGMRPRGRHHEIYLGDPRRADPARLRTILRQPVE